MKKQIEAPEWFFMWAKPKGREYITMECHWERGKLIEKMERDLGRPWVRIYRMGGRAVKCAVILK